VKNKKLFAILTLVCFMFTLMPVAAFAAPEADRSLFLADDDSAITLAKADGKVYNDNGVVTGTYPKDNNGNPTEGVKFIPTLVDDEGVATTGTIYVWAKGTDGAVSSALKIENAKQLDGKLDNVYEVAITSVTETVQLYFNLVDTYTVYAGTCNGTTPTAMTDINVFGEQSVIKVKGSSVDPATYNAYLTIDGDNTVINMADADEVFTFGTGANEANYVLNIIPNNVKEVEGSISFEYANGNPISNKTVTVDTDSAYVDVELKKAATNSQGRIDFSVSASVEGDYEIDFGFDGVEWTLKVQVGNTSAAKIETVTEPAAPQAQYETFANDTIEFVITDVNGNVVVDTNTEDANLPAGMEGIELNQTTKNGKYVVLTEKPAASNLESDDLTLAYNAGDKVWYLTGVGTMDAEGDYAVKVILDNGAYATAEWTVKKFDKPVRLIIGYATNTVDLGGTITGALKYMDKNGVMKPADDAEFVADGYAVEGFFATPIKNAAGVVTGQYDDKFTVKTKTDEKYVGTTIKVTAVSEKYDLVATTVLTVAEGASAIEFANVNAEVGVNNKLTWNVVDAAGNKVALAGGVTATDIKYVILDKPEGAKVSTNDVTVASDLAAKGEGTLSLTSNKVGVVKVQVVLKAEFNAITDGSEKTQVKYYTGIAEIAVGMDNFKDVVVMSIGSKQIVINSDVKEMLCEAVIKDGRTMVPFRAGLEALGATVDYDQATQSVIAEMNGVKVVMTLGEKAYTVNGVAKVADVAPYLNVAASTTMVPASFVANAFGINVDYTTNPDGTVADVLFAN